MYGWYGMGMSGMEVRSKGIVDFNLLVIAENQVLFTSTMRDLTHQKYLKMKL
jgi:hypothetical protein